MCLLTLITLLMCYEITSITIIITINISISICITITTIMKIIQRW